MALLHHATLTPTKNELLAAWLPSRPWTSGLGAGVERVASYRFDDPADEVGMEGMILRAGEGPVWHVPLTYRAAPLAGAEEFLLGTAEHSALGTRWVYDACGDPVWAQALGRATLTGGTQAEEYFEEGNRRESRAATATVVGSGKPGTSVGEVTSVTSRSAGPTTVISTSAFELVVAHVVGVDVQAAETLVGRWNGGDPVVLAGAAAN